MTKFTMPAMASDPYCAAAPSRRTSTRSSAIAGIEEMSTACEPTVPPTGAREMTDERWRRLLLSSTSVESGGNPRSVIGRMKVASSLIGSWLTLREGTTLVSMESVRESPCRSSSLASSTSTGTARSLAERCLARVPMTVISSRVTTP